MYFFEGGAEMKLKRMECPNCGGQVKKEADGKYLCESCGSPFVMDYDADDVEYERIKMEQEKLKNSPFTQRYARQQSVDPEVMAQRRKKVKTIIIVMLIVYFILPTFIGIIGIVGSMLTGIPLKSSSKKTTSTKITSSKRNKSNSPTPTPAPVYVSDPESILNDKVFTTYMLEAADEKIDSFETEKVPYTGGFRATGISELVSAYLVNADEESASRFKNRIYLVYKITWENDGGERIEEFFPVYLNNITIKDSGVLHSDYVINDDFRFTMKSPRIFYGYESEEQFYREELLSKEGITVSKFDPNAPQDQDE